MGADTILPSPPFDSISQLHYSPTHPSHLLVSSWDTTVRLYSTSPSSTTSNSQQTGPGTSQNQTASNGPTQKAKFEHRAAVLSCAYASSSQGFSGGLDCSVRALALETEQTTNMGAHEDAVSGMVWGGERNALITSSWDQSLRLWDPRAPGPQASFKQPERVYALALDPVGGKLVVALASRLVRIYDTRNMSSSSSGGGAGGVGGAGGGGGGGGGAVEERESSLKYLTRSLACMSSGLGYAVGSTEGRIAVEYFDSPPSTNTSNINPSNTNSKGDTPSEKYAFKCHRQTIDGVDNVWPVNALAFSPGATPVFASGGSDGGVSVWDYKVKKRLKQYAKVAGVGAGLATEVSALAWNCDGTELAVGLGYTWDQGEEGAKTAGRPGVVVKRVGDEVKPR